MFWKTFGLLREGRYKSSVVRGEGKTRAGKPFPAARGHFSFFTNAMRPLPRARAAERVRLSAISIPNETAALRAARRTDNRRCGRFCAFARRSHRRQLRRTGDAGEFIRSCRLPTAFAPVCEICRKLSGAFCRAQAIRRLLWEAHYILGAVFRASTISGVG